MSMDGVVEAMTGDSVRTQPAVVLVLRDVSVACLSFIVPALALQRHRAKKIGLSVKCKTPKKVKPHLLLDDGDVAREQILLLLIERRG
jgi:hypothetical protein